MKKQKTKKAIITIAVIVIFIAAYLLYSRPMDIQERYSMLSLDKCTEISGYYEVGTQAEMTAFSIEKGSEEFQKLCDLIFERDYSRSLKDLFPSGTRTHRTEPDDFQWEVYFHFEDVVFPDALKEQQKKQEAILTGIINE